MASVRQPTEANVEVADFLTSHNWPTTPRDVRTWISRRWIVREPARALGYGRGTVTLNSPELLRRALAIAELKMGKRTAPHVVVLGLFARGFEVDVDQLRAAYVAYFENLERAIERQTKDLSDPLEKADYLAEAMVASCGRSRTGRFLLKRSGLIGETAESVLKSALSIVCASLLDCDPEEFATRMPNDEEPDALDDLLATTGIAGFSKDHSGGVGPIVDNEFDLRDDMLDFLFDFSLSKLKQASQELPVEMLRTGRERLRVLVPFLKGFARFAQLSGGPRDAFGLIFATKLRFDEEATAVLSLLLAKVESEYPGRYEQIAPMFEAGAQKFVAATGVLERLQPRLRRYLGASGALLLAKARPELRDLLRSSLKAIYEAEPELIKQAAQPLPDPIT
jgi:hypothetical protein